jgi:small subunit ribosomal protein S16
MLKLRLKRTGRKNDPAFRVVITEATSPPKGKYLESVGSYRPASKELKLDKERIEHWLSKGVQPTDVVHNILVKEGILTGAKRSVHSTRVRKKSEEAAAAEKPASASESEAEKEEAVSDKQQETSDKGEGGETTEEVPAEPTKEEETKPEEAPAEPTKEEEAKPEELAEESKPEEPAEPEKQEEAKEGDIDKTEQIE